jgi:hypothetical protein
MPEQLWESDRMRRPGRTGFLSASVLATSLAIAGVACGADSTDEGGESPATEADDSGSSASQGPPDADGTWAALLASIPDTPENRSFVQLGDVAALASAQGVDVIEPDASDREVGLFFSDVQGFSDEVPILLPATERMATLDQSESMRAELGWSYAAVDEYALAGESPDVIEVVRGRFDADGIERALDDVPYWSELQEVVEHGDAAYYRWGDDLASDPEHHTPARPIGFGGRMLVSDDRITWTRSDEAMEAAIDAEEGEAPLLADEGFASIAEALQRDGVQAAFITTEVIDGRDGAEVFGGIGDEQDIAAYEEEIAAGEHTLLEGVESYASGWGLDDDGDPVTVLVLVSGSEDQAEADVDRFAERLESESSTLTRQPYRERISIVDSEVEGRTTVFVLEADRPNIFLDMSFRRDPLIASEP